VKISNWLVMRMYGMALWLYPAAFRAQYGVEMRDAVARLHAESSDDLRFVVELGWDVMKTSMREQLRFAGAPDPGFGVAFAVFFSGVLVAVSVGHQQWLRRAADQGPERLVASGQVAAGPSSELSSPAWLESSTPFVVRYDAAGRAMAGDVTLHGALPQPPKGIFDVIRQRGLYKVTWQPQRSIRVALVGEKLHDGGFVLAGQSLLQTETRVGRFDRWLLWMWGVMVAAVCVVVGRGMVRRTA